MSGHNCSIIRTADETDTLFCTEYNQTMHSDSGAYEEAVNMHVLPSEVLDSPGESISVLDIGFGLGYNVLALFIQSDLKCPSKAVSVVSLEKDREFAPYIRNISFNDHRNAPYELIRSAYEKGRLRFGRLSMDFRFNDARESIKRLPDEHFDAVFHDPFSPGMNPELWSVEFFETLLLKMKHGARLTTYSSAPQIRGGLVSAGFSIARGPSFGRKKEGTVACRGMIQDSVDREYLSGPDANIKATPYRDRGLCCSRDEIVSRRLEEMKERRSRACRQALQE